ncbi:YciI family protein [Pelagicoccus sp. SDUM812003]|uniref:YciI family protein n=1 Tax=Pelagicoccus sp. SDUM812003 TaxID=3041267 RepID=UPI00280E4871|nr:YciI family protein [Pelagicoccus sp. SDUM812003]MDQ8201396.1 YciI family protein [Pelagicoccus sp. SDUM812003]
MKYMLLTYGKEDAWTEEERESCMLESMAICDELEAQGKWIASSPLYPVDSATSLRIRDGKRQITDGPFAETNEQLGGYYIIDVDDLDEAISIASRLPPAKKGTVEIRPLFPLPERSAEAEARYEGKPV